MGFMLRYPLINTETDPALVGPGARITVFYITLRTWFKKINTEFCLKNPTELINN